MGAVSTPGGGNYYRVSLGKLRRKADQNTPNAVPRTYEDKETKESKVVYEIVEDAWQGKIVSLERKQDEKKNIVFTIGMEDEENVRANFQMIMDSGYGMDILKRMLAREFDFMQPCIIQPHEITEGKDKKYYFTITQNSNKIKSPYTKEFQENPNIHPNHKLPAWNKIELGGGKVHWDKFPQLEFLWYHVTNKARTADPMFRVVDQLSQQAPPAQQPQQAPPAQQPPAQQPYPQQGTWTPPAAPPDDDLPF